MKFLLLVVLVLIGSFVEIQAVIKQPGWKHCIHPIHALPNQWGQIVSPGFPSGINTQIQCSWVISSNPGYRVKLAFSTLNVTGSRKSCYTQFVEILDFKVGHSMGKFCGTSRPGDYVSWGPKLRFDLQGDTSGAKTKGFDVRFKATKEQGGFKPTWTFPLKTKSPKPPKRKPPRDRPRSRPPTAPKRPPRPAAAKPPPRPPLRPPAPKAPAKPAVKNTAPRLPKAPLLPPPSAILPPRPPRPTQSNRIEFRQPPPQRSGPIIYGEKANTRGVDHGQSSVIKINDDPEPPLQIYVIVGIAAGGVVALVILAIIMKMCICNKSDKRNEQRKEMEKRRSAPNQNVETGENFAMGMMPGLVPEQYMTEQIMPAQSYHRLQSLPALPQQIGHQYHPMMYAHSVRSSKSRSGQSTRGPHDRVRSSRSRTRSGVSRRESMTHTKSRRSKSLPRKRSRSLQYLPSQIDGWIRVDQPPLEASASKRRYPSDRGRDTSDSASSSEWDSDSSRSYKARSEPRSKRHGSLPRMASHPPPYDSAMGQPYYIKDTKSRDFDEGYNTGKRSNEIKSGANKRMKDRRKGKKNQRRRKNSY